MQRTNFKLKKSIVIKSKMVTISKDIAPSPQEIFNARLPSIRPISKNVICICRASYRNRYEN